MNGTDLRSFSFFQILTWIGYLDLSRLRCVMARVQYWKWAKSLKLSRMTAGYFIDIKFGMVTHTVNSNLKPLLFFKKVMWLSIPGVKPSKFDNQTLTQNGEVKAIFKTCKRWLSQLEIECISQIQLALSKIDTYYSSGGSFIINYLQ